jgi:hypothetical protein
VWGRGVSRGVGTCTVLGYGGVMEGSGASGFGGWGLGRSITPYRFLYQRGHVDGREKCVVVTGSRGRIGRVDRSQTELRVWGPIRSEIGDGPRTVQQPGVYVRSSGGWRQDEEMDERKQSSCLRAV